MGKSKEPCRSIPGGRMSVTGYIEIDPELCKDCRLCISVCPQQLIEPSEQMNQKGYRPVRLPENRPRKTTRNARDAVCALSPVRRSPSRCIVAKVLDAGNHIVAEAAVRAGCRYYFGYPITPQNETPEYMAERLSKIGRRRLYPGGERDRGHQHGHRCKHGGGKGR